MFACCHSLPILFMLLTWVPACPADEHVTYPFVGVTIREIRCDQPRPLAVCVAEIDLQAEGISFLVTPGNGDPNGEEPDDPNGETTRQTALELLAQQSAQLAINATFFAVGEFNTDNIGLVVSAGQPVSPAGDSA